jgi:hypothetical protein
MRTPITPGARASAPRGSAERRHPGATARALVPLVLGALLLSGCAIPGLDALGTQPESGIDLQVVIGPTCPVERAEASCPDQPFTATIVIQEQPSGREVDRVESDTGGHARIPLPPGDYTLVPLSPTPGAPPYAEPQDVTVEAGRYTAVTIRYISGIL